MTLESIAPDRDAFNASVQWLLEQKRRKTVNKKRTSYGLKHDAERAMTERGQPIYILESAFIAAAIHLGIAYERTNGGSVYLAIGV